MNILTDILSLIKQDKYASSATDNDVISIGVHEPPDMLGIASPIPNKSVKVIFVLHYLSKNEGSKTPYFRT